MRMSRCGLIGLVGLLVASCGTSDPSRGATTSVERAKPAPAPGEARANLARSTATAPVDAAVESTNRLGFALLASELGAAKGNVALSPWSIATALTMARAGARGQTAAEMDAVLHIADPATIHASANALDAALAKRNGTIDMNGGRLVVELSAANRAFAQRDYAFEQPFLDTLAADYGVGVGLVDYKADAEAARAVINRWVATQTKDRIPTLIAPGTLDALTRLVLVNAIFLRADWQVPFEATLTKPAPFHAPSGAVDVPTMHGSSHRRFASGDGWRAVELAYTVGDLAMVVVLPDEGRFEAVAVTLPTVLGATKAGTPTQVDLSLPRFDIASSVGLKSRLSELGMPTAFGSRADFTGMSTTEQLLIADVVHQANVTVNEHGTVASAATAVVIAATSAAPMHIEQMVVDRPFLFTIVDRPTGAILFAGQVTNPA